jgi:hypothetical protein
MGPPIPTSDPAAAPMLTWTRCPGARSEVDTPKGVHLSYSPLAAKHHHLSTRRRRGQSVPMPIWPSPRLPGGAVPLWGVAARRVPARVITSGPTGSDPTSSVPFPPAATSGPLDRASSDGQDMNSRVREGQRKRKIRQRASCTQSHKSSRSREHCSPHQPSSRRLALGRISLCPI